MTRKTIVNYHQVTDHYNLNFFLNIEVREVILKRSKHKNVTYDL